MTNVVIAASLVIAGCSLAVSVTGGVNERKRPFSLLAPHRRAPRRAAPAS